MRLKLGLDVSLIKDFIDLILYKKISKTNSSFSEQLNINNAYQLIRIN